MSIFPHLREQAAINRVQHSLDTVSNRRHPCHDADRRDCFHWATMYVLLGRKMKFMFKIEICRGNFVDCFVGTFTSTSVTNKLGKSPLARNAREILFETPWKPKTADYIVPLNVHQSYTREGLNLDWLILEEMEGKETESRVIISSTEREPLVLTLTTGPRPV